MFYNDCVYIDFGSTYDTSFWTDRFYSDGQFPNFNHNKLRSVDINQKAAQINLFDIFSRVVFHKEL